MMSTTPPKPPIPTLQPAVPPPPPAAPSRDNLTEAMDWGSVDITKVIEAHQTDDGMLLKNIPARTLPDGTVADQLWVRAFIGGQPDLENLMTVKRAGWLPRPPHTAHGMPASELSGFFSGMTAQVIQSGDAILMERHKKLGDAERRLVAEANADQFRSVRQQVNGYTPTSGDAMSGGMQVTMRSSRRRGAAIQSD